MTRHALAALCFMLLACSGESVPVQSDGAPSEAVEFTGTTRSPVAPPAPPPAPQAASRAAAREEGFAKGQAGMIADGAALPAIPAAAGASTAMLIRTGSASLEVSDVGAAIGRVRQLAAALGGYVANTSVQSGREQTPSATLELKIPAARFDQAVNGLEPLGRVEAVNVHAQDVGEEYVDVAARIANAKRLEERLVALLAARAGRLEDILAVERELARIRAEIERLEARMRYLETHVAMSTLVVTVHEPHPVLGGPRSPIGEAFREAWRNFVGFVAWLIAALGILVPVAALGAGAYALTMRAYRHRRSVAS